MKPSLGCLTSLDLYFYYRDHFGLLSNSEVFATLSEEWMPLYQAWASGSPVLALI
jgi:hypothetical protein